MTKINTPRDTQREEETKSFVISETKKYFDRQVTAIQNSGAINEHIFSHRFFRRIVNKIKKKANPSPS